MIRQSYERFVNLGSVAVVSDPSSDSWAVSRYFYDKDGQRTASINALGYVSTQTYDGNGNVTKVTEYASAGSISADGKLILPGRSDDDRVAAFVYDKANRQVSQVVYATTDWSGFRFWVA